MMGGGAGSVSHVESDGRGRGASAMLKVMRGVRVVSHVQGDGRGEERQPCSM